MKILAGLLVLAASLQPYIVWADSGSSAVAAAAAAAAANGGSGASTATTIAIAVTTIYNAPSAHIPCSCECIYKPVCGCDGKTYSNECVLRCISAHRVEHKLEPIHFQSHGVCPDTPCNCTLGGNKICGSDGQIYCNECYFKCENKRRELLCIRPIQVAHPSTCRIPTCICPKDVIPVCGTDGRTYRNICVLQCVSRLNKASCKSAIRLKHGGACDKENCVCPLVEDPLCCSDGKTYHNQCHVHCENRKRYQLGKTPLVVQYKGQCVACRCPKIYDPVCACNGQTFANTCTLDCENKRRKAKKLPLLTIDRYGVCPCKCTLEYYPVCGTDDRTYSNKCKLNCENKRRFDLGLVLIGIANYGRCECRCRHCPRKYEPVCGSDGRTYWNRCWLACNRGCSNDVGYRPHVLCNGPC